MVRKKISLFCLALQTLSFYFSIRAVYKWHELQRTRKDMNVLTRRSGSLVVFYTLKSLSRWEIGLTEWIIDTFQLSGHGLPTNTNSDQVSDIRYGIGTMANDVEEAEELLVEHDYSLLNILGIARTVKKGLRKLHTFFCGFWLQEPGNRATDRKTKSVAAALQHLHPTL